MTYDPTPFDAGDGLQGNDALTRNWTELNMIHGRYMELRKALDGRQGDELRRAVAEFERLSLDPVIPCNVNPGIGGRFEDSPELIALKSDYVSSFSSAFDKPTAAIGITCSGEFVWLAADKPDSWSAADAYRIGELKFAPSGDRWFQLRFGRSGNEVVADMISRIKSGE
ncbi:MAG: hypothetical protein AB7F40_02850 [Victivallaceae bacterium]